MPAPPSRLPPHVGARLVPPGATIKRAGRPVPVDRRGGGGVDGEPPSSWRLLPAWDVAAWKDEGRDVSARFISSETDEAVGVVDGEVGEAVEGRGYPVPPAGLVRDRILHILAHSKHEDERVVVLMLDRAPYWGVTTELVG